MLFPELKDKRLLVLGGNPWKDAIKHFAEENKITIICAGNNPNADLNSISNEYYNVNSIDHNAMKELIMDKSIDGVYMGANELVISHACEYINELGLPCYCKKDQWDCMQNKEMFKKCLMEVGLPVVPIFFIDYNNPILKENDFPVITKPIDGSGSNGFSVCYNNEQLKFGVLKAINSSISKKVIVEKFVRNSGHVVFYTVSNGKIFFSGLSDKYPVKFKNQGSYVGGLFCYESNYVKEFRNKFEKRIQILIDNLGIKEGSFWIEVFHDGDLYYFNEAGYRYGGSISIYPVDYFYSINQVASDIYFALTGRSKILGHSSLFNQNIQPIKKYAIYPIYVQPGIIKKIVGVENLLMRSNILKIFCTKQVGTRIAETGSFGQSVLLIHFVFDTNQDLRSTILSIHETISIIDTENQNMIIEMLDINQIFE